MKRVKVDFSTTVRDGLIRANQKRASETLYEGDEVLAFDPGEDMEFEGVVDHLSDDGQFAFLRMYWEDSIPVYNEPGVNLVVEFWSQAPAIAALLLGDDYPRIQVAPPPPPIVAPAAEHLMPA
jgi:hypothetical protein